MNRYAKIRVAHAHERVSTQSFVILILGNSKSNHLGPQGTSIDGERTSMADEDERRITDENLSEGMAIGAKTSRAPAVNSQRL